MKISENARETQKITTLWKREGRVALVTTMGALHAGHMALVKKAKTLADKVVATIFVNPMQFGPKEDLDKYPRTFESDKAKLEAVGVDLLFYPSVKEMYRDGFLTSIKVSKLDEPMEGKSRPGFFTGVATVCQKLFQICQNDFAIYGEKDFQQTRILEQMVLDLNLAMEIVRHPTVREPDGLAMSSRNAYLSNEDREKAPRIFHGFQMAKKEVITEGKKAKVGKLLELVKKELKGFKIDYVAIASEDDLLPALPSLLLGEIHNPRIFVAAKLGTTRLIDNAAL